MVEIEHSGFVSELKEIITKQLELTASPRLVFTGRELEDNQRLSYYKIQRESVVHMMGKQTGGYSIPLSTVLENVGDKTVLTKNTNWEFDNENGKSFVSFKPIYDTAGIPFYDAVTKQTYHNGLNNEDRTWINQYTTSKYKRLKVQSYILDPDEEHIKFLQGLYLACWVAVQSNLPFKVYHVCNVTEKSYSWYEENRVFYTPAFISTSRKEDLKWPGNCKWEITLTKGNRHHAVDVKEMSAYPDEDEILISCCTRFKVLSKHKDHKGYAYYIYLEYLDV